MDDGKRPSSRSMMSCEKEKGVSLNTITRALKTSSSELEFKMSINDTRIRSKLRRIITRMQRPETLMAMAASKPYLLFFLAKEK